MRDLSPELRHLLAAQADVVSTRQITEFVSVGVVRANVRAGRWQRVGRSALVTHNGPLTGLQQVWSVLLQCPRGSAVSGPTAMAHDGLPDAWAKGIHVTIPCGQRTPLGLRGATVHWSNFLGPGDVVATRGPRRTRLARSVVDWASWQPSDRAARVVILRAMQNRRVTGAELRAAVATRGPCRHHAVILESIVDAEGGIDSLPEHDFRTLVRAGGLPEPTHQEVRQGVDGRYLLDAHWEKYRLSAEIQGVHHFEVLTRDADLERQNDLVVEGESLLLFTSYAVRRQQDMVAGTLRRALYRRGWTEPLTESRFAS